MAVAQHYGLPTGYIDLSQSFDVASFFACCRYNKQSKKWEAVTEGEGIIYVLDRRKFPPGIGPKAICLQPFPRPSEQWGWVHEVTLGEDFDSLPHVRKFIFKHDFNESKEILEKFQYGNILFPFDPLAKLADRIMESKSIPSSIARNVINDLLADPQGLPGISPERILSMIAEAKAITFTDALLTIIDNQLDREMHDGWEKQKGNFLNGRGILLVRTVRKNNPPS